MDETVISEHRLKQNKNAFSKEQHCDNNNINSARNALISAKRTRRSSSELRPVF